MSGRGVPDSSTERSPSKMAAMPALSSAERIVSPAEQTTSAMRQVASSQIWRCSMTASMPAQGFTVSRCAENPMRPGTVPGKCAMRLPVSDPVSATEVSKVTENPISASFSAQYAAMGASCHDGLSMDTISKNDSSTRSGFIRVPSFQNS